MTQARFSPDAIIPEESYMPEKLQEPLVDFLQIIPKHHTLRDYSNLNELRTWQAYYRSINVPFAVCRHQRKNKTIWRLWKHIHVHYQTHDTQTKEEQRDVFGVSTECVCPGAGCGKRHRLVMDWKGRGIPRKYCPQCQANVSHLSAGLDGCGEFNRRAARGLQISTRP